MQKSTKAHETDGIHTDVEALLNMRSLAKDFKLETKQNSRASLDGASRSVRRGRGMEFSEVRHYQPGDDVRNIDWRVTARTQQTFTKLFQEEKERPVYVLVDQRSSMFFGSVRQFKSVLAAEISAFIAWCALANNDKISAMVFSDSKQSDLRPKRGKHAVLRYIHELAQFNQELSAPFTPKGQSGQALAAMLQELLRVARPGSAVYVISDFHDIDEECERALSLISRHSDITLVHIYDPLEKTLPRNARLNLTDGEQRVVVDTGSKATQEAFQSSWQHFCGQLKSKAISLKTGLYSASTAHDSADFIQQTFKSSRKGGR